MKSANILRRHADLACQCLEGHTPGKPFTPTLSNFLKSSKSFGSKDRKRIRAMCYAWFRLGFSISLSMPNQVLLSFLVLNPESEPLDESIVAQFDLPASWFENNLEQRLAFLTNRFAWEMESLFPMDMVSSQISHANYLQHQLQQPLLWLHVRDVDKQDVMTILEEEKVEVVISSTGSIGVPGSTPIDRILIQDQYEIQDLSSQLVMKSCDDISFKNIWDCCAGSGGKSLNLGRKNPKLKIFVSDIRPNILTNLKSRFKSHKLFFESAVIDLEVPQKQLVFKSDSGIDHTIKPSFFDLVIADVPCSGSGTWNRNPEHVFTFDHVPEKLLEKQKNILQNAWNFVSDQGHLLYITCSVFAIENEGQTEFFEKNNKVEIVNQGYVIGPEHQSDSMFYALIKRI